MIISLYVDDLLMATKTMPLLVEWWRSKRLEKRLENKTGMVWRKIEKLAEKSRFSNGLRTRLGGWGRRFEPQCVKMMTKQFHLEIRIHTCEMLVYWNNQRWRRLDELRRSVQIWSQSDKWFRTERYFILRIPHPTTDLDQNDLASSTKLGPKYMSQSNWFNLARGKLSIYSTIISDVVDYSSSI